MVTKPWHRLRRQGCFSGGNNNEEFIVSRLRRKKTEDDDATTHATTTIYDADGGCVYLKIWYSGYIDLDVV